MTKRRRTAGGQFVVATRSKRPIDKDLVGVVITNAGTTQRTTVLKTTTFPCTLTGLRWSFTYVNVLATDTVQGIWVIMVIPDGEAINTISISDGATIIAPEQAVMAYGSLVSGDADLQGPITQVIEGSTKTMRKMRGGDVLQFAVILTAGTAGRIRGAIQFFCKS